MRQQFEVNVIGLAAVTAAFSPLFERPGGRIIHLSSVSGLFSAAMSGPYSASKHAVEAMADAMRVETRGQGLFVSLIEPASVATEIHEKNRSRADFAMDRMPEEGRKKCRGAYGAFFENSNKYAANAVPSTEVARAVLHALTARKPKARYPIGRQAKIISFIFPFLPTGMQDRISGNLAGF